MAQRGREKIDCSTGFAPPIRNLDPKPGLNHDVFVSGARNFAPLKDFA
jgi:hypothetical protein